MRLLQVNAWTIRLKTRVIDMVAHEAPDIITLQEVLESKHDLGFFPSLSELSEHLGFRHTFFSPVYSLSFAGYSAEFGNAIVCRQPFQERDTVFTNLSYVENIKLGIDDYNVRNFQHIVVEDKGGKKIHVINHHGYHIPEHKNGNKLTLKACQQIVDYANSLEGPVIITGDFNLHPTSPSIAVINNYFRNLTQEYNLTTTRTDLTYKTEACDYIFINEHVVVNDFYVSSIVASDHQALILDFEVE